MLRVCSKMTVGKADVVVTVNFPKGTGAEGIHKKRLKNFMRPNLGRVGDGLIGLMLPNLKKAVWSSFLEGRRENYNDDGRRMKGLRGFLTIVKILTVIVFLNTGDKANVCRVTENLDGLVNFRRQKRDNDGRHSRGTIPISSLNGNVTVSLVSFPS